MKFDSVTGYNGITVSSSNPIRGMQRNVPELGNNPFHNDAAFGITLGNQHHSDIAIGFNIQILWIGGDIAFGIDLYIALGANLRIGAINRHIIGASHRTIIRSQVDAGVDRDFHIALQEDVPIRFNIKCGIIRPIHEIDFDGVIGLEGVRVIIFQTTCSGNFCMDGFLTQPTTTSRPGAVLIGVILVCVVVAVWITTAITTVADICPI